MNIPGGWYTSALPQRQYASLIANQHVLTHAGIVPLPSPGENPLYTLAHEWNGVFYIAGQSHIGRGTLLWSARTRAWAIPFRECYGQSPCLFHDNLLLAAVSTDAYAAVDLETGEITGPFPLALGSQGFRNIDDGGAAITGDETLDAGRRVAQQLGVTGYWNYTYLRELLFGQGDDGFHVRIDGQRRLIEPGSTTFGRVVEADGVYAIGLVKPGYAVAQWLTREELAALPVVEPARAPIVALGRKHWHGFFEFAPRAASAVPFNCYVDVRDAEPLLVLTASGVKIAQYVAAEAEGNQPAAFERRIANARRANPTLPVIAYWPRTADTRLWQSLPSADLVGVEMYWGVDESESMFEARCRATVLRCVNAGRKVVGIPQCYTSNGTLVKDLERVASAYSRIVKGPWPSGFFDHTLGFSNRGRQTGLNDHPEATPAWTEFFRGIPGQPPITVIDVSTPPIPDPPDPPVPPTDPMPSPDPAPPIDEEDMAQTQERFEELLNAAGELYAKVYETFKMPFVDGANRPTNREAFVIDAAQHAREAGDRQRVDGLPATLDAMIWNVFLSKGTKPLSPEDLDKVQKLINSEQVRLRR